MSNKRNRSTEPEGVPPDHVGVLVSAAVMIVVGWGGLYLLITRQPPLLAWQLWVFFVLLHVAITGMAIPIVRYLNVRFTPIAVPLPPGGIIVRQSVWIGLYTVTCAWLQIPRVLTPIIAVLLALVFIAIEVFLRIREIPANALMNENLLRTLPSVDKLLLTSSGQALVREYGREAVIEALRTGLDAARHSIRTGDTTTDPRSITPDALMEQAAIKLAAAFRPTLRPVINATGVIIHTNLGRAPLSKAAQQAMIDVAAGYSTLEYDLQTGKRGSRLIHAGELLKSITGAEAALVVNNNAAATVLMLAALAKGKEVIVSRGQLVEIGGGFRVPDIMRQSGARLVEVGTTNRTRAADYEHAIREKTALLMRVHSSNFKQIGFTEAAAVEDLARIAHQHDIYAVDDLGSGALLDTVPFGLEHEPTVGESLAAGMDVVAFSGDKLLGGPQAGILVGKREIIDLLKRHPLARAIRADKLCLAALSATLDHYRKGEALTHIPVWQMIARPLSDLQATAERWKEHYASFLQNHDTLQMTVVSGESAVGGGSLPGATLPTALLRLHVPHPDLFMVHLRRAAVPVIARIADDEVVFDPRTVLPDQEAAFLDSVFGVLHEHYSSVG